MKIINAQTNDIRDNKTISDYVSKKLSGRDYDKGEIEEHAASIMNILDAIGNLCDVLVQKNMLTAKELSQIIGSSLVFKEVKRKKNA
jgi:hypothetical protein